MEDAIKEIKSRIDIVNLINEYVPLTKGGKNYKGLCPFHNEKTPSFMVSRELGIFKCFGCGLAGDSIKFIQEAEGLEFVEALNLLAKKAGVILKPKRQKTSPEEIKIRGILEINQLAGEFFHFILTKNKFGKKALDYLKNRGIKNDTIKTFKLGYAPNSWDSLLRFLLKRGYDIALIAASGLVVPKEHSSGFYDRFRGRVIIPLRNERGEIISFSGRALGKIEPKYINGPETSVFKKERFLYNLDLARSEIKRKKEAILVEGYFDAISPYQEETKNVVASSGTSLTTGQLSLIKKYSETLVIFYDTDTAGIEATKRALSLAQEIKLDVKVGILPDNIKDPDEAIQKDKKIFEKALQEAVSVYDFYFNFAQKHFDIKDALGKKRASDFLLPIIADIKHDIQKAHYIKKLSSVIDISEDAIVQALLKIANTNHLNDKISRTSPATDSGSKLSSEEYIIALILKVPNDLAQKTLYKLSNEDFYYDETKNLFVKLKEYMLEKERFLIKNFYLKLTDDERKLAEKLYLMEISLADNENIDQEVLEKEIKKIFDIINKETIRRKLKSLSGLIKNAEQEDNTDQLSRLQYEFSLLSKKVKSS